MFQLSVALVLLASFILFFWNARRKVWRIIFAGQASPVFDDPIKRLKIFAIEVLAQRKLMRQKIPGIIHFIIFWGFIFLSLGTLEWMIYGLTGGQDFSKWLPESLNGPYLLSQDFFNGAVLVMVLLALYRRIVVKPKRMADNSVKSRWDAYFILALIGGLVISSVLTHAISIHQARHPGEESWLPLSHWMAGFMGSEFDSEFVYYTFWWMHLGIVLVFLNYLPFSKHLHVIAAFPNVALSKTAPRGQLSTPNLEDESITSFGAEKVENLKWKSILDSFACTECGRCNEFCPTASTGKALRPKTLMIDLRAAASRRASLYQQVVDGNLAIDKFTDQEKLLYKESLVPQTFSDQFIWDCTTCGACVEACPVMIDHVDSIVEMRRALVLNRGSNPDEATNAFRNWETNSNPWGLPEEQRQQWLVEKGVPIFEAGADFDYLYYVGCAGSYDDRNKKVVDSVIELLQTAKVKFGILGKEERCNGETARRMGNEYLAQQMIKTNLELLQGRAVKRVITSCPHCFNSLKNEYPAFGGKFEVIHHSVLLEQLVKEGRIPLKSESSEAITYHDSCYIGRYNQIYDEPRELLKRVGAVRELPRSKEKGFCCGAGGGRMWLEEKTGSRINENRVDEILESDVKKVGVACPFCMTMISDGLKSKARPDVVVKDVAEWLAGAVDDRKV